MGGLGSFLGSGGLIMLGVYSSLIRSVPLSSSCPISDPTFESARFLKGGFIILVEEANCGISSAREGAFS